MTQKEEPKQEITLEEAAEILYPYDGVNEDYKIDSKMWSFIAGAKWQQERMYSDMQEYAEFCIECDRANLKPIIAKDWFEQFKKK